MARVLEVEDHHDVAEIAVELGRQIGVAAVEGEAVHAGAVALPIADFDRFARIGNVEDAEPAALRPWACPGAAALRG